MDQRIKKLNIFIGNVAHNSIATFTFHNANPFKARRMGLKG